MVKFAPTTGDPPTIPPFRPVTDYFDFGDTSAIADLGSIEMNAPLKFEAPPGYNLEFFEYSNGTWIDLKPAMSDGLNASASFDPPFPPNLIVLAEPSQ